jgi:HEAT repeat protein
LFSGTPYASYSLGNLPGGTILSKAGGDKNATSFRRVGSYFASIAKFLGKQLKDPAMKALGVDPLSKAFRRALESFLLSLQAEYERREVLHTLLRDSIEASVSAFVNAESVHEALARPFRDTDSFDVSALAALWGEIPGPGGVGKLVDLPPAFDWDAVGATYLQAVHSIVTETPQLREIWQAKNLDDIRRSVEGMRGVVPRFDLEKYRRVLIEEFGTLKLSAIRADYDQNFGDRSVALQSIYVQQQVKEAFPPRDLSRDYRKRLQAKARLYGISDESPGEDLADAYQRTPARPLKEVLGDPSCQRLVVLGDPGLGKSTLLQHLALDWAQGASTSIPFLIELRKYAGDHAKPRNFLEFLESGTWCHCHIPQSELDHYLREREVAVLFDGLDEIFDESRRSNIVTEIINFGRDYPNAKVIVTTRVMGYAVGSPNPDHFLAASFRQFTLQDFDDSEIRQFVRRWHAITISDSEEREKLTGRLTSAITESRAIRELAGNPLLLTMMVLLNRRKHLPRERLNLYDSCAELLVEGWDAARHLDHSEYLTHDDKIEILQRVAFEMQHEREGLGGNMISEARLRNVLISALRDRGIPGPRMAAQKIIGALAERDFMLCFTGDDQFAFVHRTFLEYFCAREYLSHLANAGGKDELIELFRARWLDDAWHEVLRLICAMTGPNLAADLVKELLDARVKEQGWRAVFLAAECTGEIRQAGRVEAVRAATHHELLRLLDFEASSENREVRDDVDTEVVSVRKGALDRIVRLGTGEATRGVLQFAARNQYWAVRFAAVEALVKYWKDDATRRWLVGLTGDESGLVRQAAVHGLAVGWPDETTRELLLRLLGSPDMHTPKSELIQQLSQRWPEQTTWQWLVHRIIQDTDSFVTHEAVRELARRWKDEPTREWLIERVTKDERTDVRHVAAKELARNWPRERVEKRMMELANQNDDPAARDAALIALVRLRDEGLRHFVLKQMSHVEDTEARSEILWQLVLLWPDKKTMHFLLTCALEDKHSEVRGAAIHQLTRQWRSESTRRLLLNSDGEVGKDTRIRFMHELVRQWKDNRTRKVLAEIAAQDKSAEVRQAALTELVRAWPDAPISLVPQVRVGF